MSHLIFNLEIDKLSHVLQLRKNVLVAKTFFAINFEKKTGKKAFCGWYSFYSGRWLWINMFYVVSVLDWNVIYIFVQKSDVWATFTWNLHNNSCYAIRIKRIFVITFYRKNNIKLETSKFHN